MYNINPDGGEEHWGWIWIIFRKAGVNRARRIVVEWIDAEPLELVTALCANIIAIKNVRHDTYEDSYDR